MSNFNPYIIENFLLWENIISESEDKFIETFCKKAWILSSVSWNSENMIYSYILPSGQHVGYSVKMDKWLDFIDDLHSGAL